MSEAISDTVEEYIVNFLTLPKIGFLSKVVAIVLVVETDVIVWPQRTVLLRKERGFILKRTKINAAIAILLDDWDTERCLNLTDQFRLESTESFQYFEVTHALDMIALAVNLLSFKLIQQS